MHEDNEYICSNCGRAAELHPILSEEGDCYDPKPPRVMQTEDAPDTRCSDCPRLYDTEGPLCDDCPPLTAAHNPMDDYDDPSSMEGSYRPEFANKPKFEPVADVGGALPEIHVTKEDLDNTARQLKELDSRGYGGLRDNMVRMSICDLLDNFNCRERQLKQYVAENAELRRKLATPGETAWIDCKQELPQHGQMVIGSRNGRAFIYRYNSAACPEFPFRDEFGSGDGPSVTHWQPLPNPPEATQ